MNNLTEIGAELRGALAEADIVAWLKNHEVAAVTVFVAIAEEWKQRNGPETGGCDRGSGRAGPVGRSRVGRGGDGVRRDSRGMEAKEWTRNRWVRWWNEFAISLISPTLPV